MVVIRLSRVGKKNSPAYRVVVADKQRSAKRKYIEVIGHYNPAQKPKIVVIDKDRALFWMEKGAKPSDTVNNLMVDLSILKKSEKINKKYAKSSKKKSEANKEQTDKTESPKADSGVSKELKDGGTKEGETDKEQKGDESVDDVAEE